ncbi:MAG TPA: HemK/PrmC family methyltransferase [Candidatus Saccharimonadales bacterium]|nr:HemK/PrmC family methyltransferase [Candidatus Saccharimonadales bacterium]
MTIETFLEQAVAQLKAAGIATARLDCLVLLEDELGANRATLLAHPEREIDPPPLLKLNKKIAQRQQNVPLAYIRGKAEFYGREFLVNKNVLVPRPESEKLIDLLKGTKWGMPTNIVPLHIADVGTGSGCLGVTAGLEIPGAHIDLYDVSSPALGVALQNAKQYKLEHITYTLEHLFNDPVLLRRRYDVVLANLPYVPDDYEINAAAAHEPKIALFAGKDGLNLYRTFWRQLSAMAERPRFVITESFPFQHAENAKLAKTAGYSLETADDFAQRFIVS